jgi:DNA (cytosine-5)-methyltransferase 1
MIVDSNNTSLKSLELFTGAGGLALGMSRAGFAHAALVELNVNACESLRDNSKRLREMKGWPVHQLDVHDFDFQPYAGGVALIAAGAPCQPFSLGGKHAGHADSRNLFPQVFRAVRETHSPAVVIENVKGLLRASFKPYFDYIVSSLSAPDVTPKKSEDWIAHKSRLERMLKTGRYEGVRYKVSHTLFNAADYGVPQRRERVFIVALRADLEVQWIAPRTTHSEEALLYAKWIDGSYWRDHGLRQPKRPKELNPRLQRLENSFVPPQTHRWRTVRDALIGLPEPVDYEPNRNFFNHVGNPGARTYPGHTGSPLDEPAKTLKAGDHGVPGGENILRRANGSVRYFTVREAARLQGFPDDYNFSGAWSEGFRQLGNAVPVELAQVVGSRVRELLEKSRAKWADRALGEASLERVA